MGFRYVVLGAGRQGTAAAFDLAVNGSAHAVVLADVDGKAAKASADRVNRLGLTSVASAAKVDVRKPDTVLKVLRGADVFISGVPYYHNPALAKLAVKAKVSMVDFGGRTDLAREQLALDEKARAAHIAIVPECGLGPGANITLAVHAMSLLDKPEEVRIYDGGLPQRPRPPWDYDLLFNIEGLTNEYAGSATYLRNGKRVEVPALSEPEDIAVAPLGKLEARATAGGLSTMPWTFEGRLKTLEMKTLRYPGHWARIAAFADLGLFSQEPLAIGDAKVVPREMFHALFRPRITNPEVEDFAISRTVVRGLRRGRRVEATVELFDAYDAATGFTAMERTTGWHAAIVAGMIARDEIPPGAHPVETGVPTKRFVEEAGKRGLAITERVT